MAIFRWAKAKRTASSGSSGSSSSSSGASSSLSSSPSCSSSSDGSSKVKRCSKLKRITAKPSQYLELCEKDTEICQMGEDVCRLPQELFQVDDLNQILSVDTWNNCLTEKEREQLCGFLPDLDEEAFQVTLAELLGGGNINFGNPVAALMGRLKSGRCSPKATKYEEATRYLEKLEYFHGLRKYHNDKIRLFSEMRSLWSVSPSTNIDKRMELWHARSVASGQPVPRLQFATHREVPTKGKNSIKLKLKKGRIEECEEKFGDPNMDTRARMQNERGYVNNLMAFDVGERHMNRRKDFVTGKHNTKPNAEYGIESRKAFDGKKKNIKINERKKLVLGIKANFNDFGMDLSRSDRTGRHSSERRVDRSSRSKNRKKAASKGNQNDQGLNWDSISCLPTEGNVSSSGERELMAEFMSDEEPSSRKRSKRSKEDFQEDIHSRASSRHLHAETSYSPVSTNPHSMTSSFPFSVLHFLSAVRASLLGTSEIRQQNALLVFRFHELLVRVQSNPGDIRVLSVREPLEGLLRGALKVLSSNSIRPAVQGWKPLVAHDKAAKGWCWIGPLPASHLSMDTSFIDTDADAWGISQKMLTKLQNAFIHWFDEAHEMLQLFAQLGLPPLPQKPFVLSEKERFQGLRAQRSLITINPTTAEMRVYFQQEEAIRYSLQDTVFFYTTACGEKSAVAPLKRLGGKPNSKARDHLVLRSDRPSHVTILYLVRDAAARLPRSLGTRADVAVLLRDSQYIVEDASDAQLSQVVSGALDRLRYERDPCVQFDADRKLWVYLHSDREEEDFEDDGTSSTKRWKRSRKDVMDSFESSQALLGDENPDRLPSELDYNSSPSSYAGSGDMNYRADTPELFYNHHSTSLASSFSGHLRDDNVLPLIDIPASIQSACTNMQSHPMGWEMYR